MAKSFVAVVKKQKTKERTITLLDEWLCDWRDRQKALVTIGFSNVAYNDLENLHGTLRKLKTLTGRRHDTLSKLVDVLISKSTHPDSAKIDLSAVITPEKKFEKDLLLDTIHNGLRSPDNQREKLDALLKLANVRHDILSAQFRALVKNTDLPKTDADIQSRQPEEGPALQPEPDQPDRAPKKVKITLKKRTKTP